MRSPIPSSACLCLFTTLLHKATAASIPQVQEILQPSNAHFPDGPDKLDEVDIHEDSPNLTTREHYFGFNIDRSYWSTLEFHERMNLSSHELYGNLWFILGTENQEHQFEVTVETKAVEENLLDCVAFEVDKSSLVILSKQECDFSQGRLLVNVYIAVKPHVLQFGQGTVITTENLSIIIGGGLDFETYHMKIRSVYGWIKSLGIEKFTAHEMDVSSHHGQIQGDWSLPSAITFATDDGSIQVDLIPKRWSYGPGTKGDLVARSISGSISIRMPLERDKLSMRNATTNITTESGIIRAQLVHGAVTYIRSSTGDIDADMLPYWAFYDWQGVQHNYITTECESCHTRFRIFESVIDSYYKIPPMYFARSLHKVDNGALQLSYPMDWAGSAEWSVQNGIANVHGKDYEVIRDEYGGKKGRIERSPLGSSMDIVVKNGAMDLDMSGENTRRRWKL